MTGDRVTIAIDFDLANVLKLLAGAEAKLKQDGLILCLQADGSGRVSDFEDVDIFRFDRLEQLKQWLAKPRIVTYDAGGDETEEAEA
jgi:hypothetical protein